MKRSFKTIFVLAAIIGLGPRYVVLASDDQKKLNTEVYTLGEVIVTAESIKESPTTIVEVTADDIERQNATSLGEALKLVPGLHFRQGRQTDEFYVTMRGFEQDKVLILLDGIPLYVPYEGLLNLSDIPVQNIAKIKVIKGNASVLYGPNSMGGVINIITKKGTEKPSVGLDAKISDYDTQHYTLTHGWKVGNLSYLIGASHRESDGFNLAETFKVPDSVNDSIVSAPSNPSSLAFDSIPPDKGRRENTDYDRDAFTFTSTLDLSSDNQLGLSFEYYRDDYGISPSPRYREHRRGFFYFPRYYRFTDWERYVINVSDEHQFSDTLRIKSRVFYDDYYNVLKSYDDDTYTSMDRVGPPSGRSVYDDYTSGFECYTFWDGISSNSARFGVSFKQDNHEEYMNNDPSDKLESRTWSFALEDKAQLTDDLSLTAGASYDIFDKVRRHQVSTTDDDPGNNVHAINPLAGVQYYLRPDIDLHASIARKIRFPTMRNLYASGVLGPQGDPDLEEQRSYNYELGSTWNPDEKTTMEGTLFFNDVKDYIYFDNLIGRFEQLDRCDIYGIELSTANKLTPQTLARLSYTFMRSEVHSNVRLENQYYPDLVFDPDEIPYHPQHKIDLDISHTFSWGMQADFNGSFHSRQVFIDYADPDNNQVMVAEEKRLGSYFLLNAKITQEITKQVKMYLAVDNFLDEDYQDLYLLPGRGVTAWAGVKVEL